MRAILITKHIEDISLKYSKDLFTKRRKNFSKPSIELKKLYFAIKAKRGLHRDYSNYLNTLIELYPKSGNLLNRIQPDQFDKLHTKFFATYNHLDLSKKISIDGHKQPFYKHIVSAMRYDAVRDEDFLPYVKELGIRSCVYCNANYALSLKDGNKIVGGYELDHYRPQSKFPYLCTNFFNLYPVCSSCNKSKLHKIPSFCLYSTDPKKLLPFSFKLDKLSVIKYMLSQNSEDLKILFHAPANLDHDQIFHIDATYNVLKDVAEELVWKHKIYNPSYLKNLGNSFNKKFDGTGFSRFILGAYDKPVDIHKRPLNKLIQDLARQLGILK